LEVYQRHLDRYCQECSTLQCRLKQRHAWINYIWNCSSHNYPKSTINIPSSFLHILINHVWHRQILLLLYKISILLIITQFLFPSGISVGYHHKRKPVGFFLLGLRNNTDTSRSTCPEIWTKDTPDRILVCLLRFHSPDASGSWSWWLGSVVWDKSDSRTCPSKSLLLNHFSY